MSDDKSASKAPQNLSITTAFSRTLFSGCTAVVTGAGRGIGKCVADALAGCGATVLAHPGREAGRASAHGKSSSRQDPLAADFTSRDEQDRFASEILKLTDRIDVLIHNAGTMVGRFPAGDLGDTDYDLIVELNQSAPVRITRALLPALEKTAATNGTAAIVSTVSISATTGGSPGSSIYSASKGFISTWTRSLARELAPMNIRANAVSPGVIDTDFHARYSSPEKLEKTRTAIPLQRLGTPEDCAASYLFLASGALSGYITGQVLEINGGQR